MSNQEHKGESTSINTYKNQGRIHMIHQGVYNVFELHDPNNPEVKWLIFQWVGCLPLKYAISHIQKIRITADKHTLDNMEWIVQYLRNTLETDPLTRFLIHVNISARSPNVLSDTIFVIHYSNFEVLEKFGDKLCGVKLSNFHWKISMTVALFSCPSFSRWMILATSILITSPM